MVHIERNSTAVITTAHYLDEFSENNKKAKSFREIELN